VKTTIPKILMLGTDPRGHGGIASVVLGWQQEGFFERNLVRYVVTHVNGAYWKKVTAAITSLLTVVCICSRRRPPIVHAHVASGASFFRKSILLAAARICGSKTVFHLHGGIFRQFVEVDSGFAARWWIRRTLERSSMVIALSDSSACFLSSFAPTADVRVLVNSVVMKDAAAQPLREQAARILFLGRASRQKGIFELLAAVAALHAQFSQILLVVAGDGDLTQVRCAAEKLNVSSQVLILGWIGPEERGEQLQRASIFALPSHDEGLPMAMLEAMAAGKAVVATAVGGIPEAASDHDNALLVPPRDVAALVTALRTLLEDPDLRSRLARRARETVMTRFSSTAVTIKLAAMYGELERRDG